MSSCFLACDQYNTYKLLRPTIDGTRYVYCVSHHILFSNPDIGLDPKGVSISAPVLSRCIKYFKIENRLTFKFQTTTIGGQPFVTDESDIYICCFCCKQKVDYLDMITEPADIPLYRSPQDVVYNKSYSVGPVLQDVPAVPNVSGGFRIYDNTLRTISSNTNLVLYPGEEFCFYIMTVVTWRDGALVPQPFTINPDNGAFIDYEIRFN